MGSTEEMVATSGHRMNADGTVYCQWACKDVKVIELTDELVCSGCDRPAVVRKQSTDEPER